jgi:hypothetical protein
MRGGSRSRLGAYRPYLIVGSAAGGALALLFAVHLFYLQFILVVWGAVVVAGFTIHEKRTGEAPQPFLSLGEADQLVSLQGKLAAIDRKMTKSDDEDERRYLRRAKEAVEQDIRKLRWARRESELEGLSRASGKEGLRPLRPRIGGEDRRRDEKREERHLIDSLGEAEEVLAVEPPESARARLEMIAADVRAHYNLLRALEHRGKILGDYATAWAALASILKRANLDHELRRHASRKVRGKLDALHDLAVEKGLVPAAADDARREEEKERWK